jgi:hypothetical protein
MTLEMLSHEVLRREVKDAIEWAVKNNELLMARFKEYNP